MVSIDSGDASIQQLPVGFHRLEECMRFRPSGRVANYRHLSRSTTRIECSYVVQFALPQQHTFCFILRNLTGGKLSYLANGCVEVNVLKYASYYNCAWGEFN